MTSPEEAAELIEADMGQRTRATAMELERSSRKRKQGLIPELPVLTWGKKQSNFADFQESIQTYLEAQFANNGSFIKNDQFYIPPMPEEPEADRALKPRGLIK